MAVATQRSRGNVSQTSNSATKLQKTTINPSPSKEEILETSKASTSTTSRKNFTTSNHLDSPRGGNHSTTTQHLSNTNIHISNSNHISHISNNNISNSNTNVSSHWRFIRNNRNSYKDRFIRLRLLICEIISYACKSQNRWWFIAVSFLIFLIFFLSYIMFVNESHFQYKLILIEGDFSDGNIEEIDDISDRTIDGNINIDVNIDNNNNNNENSKEQQVIKYENKHKNSKDSSKEIGIGGKGNGNDGNSLFNNNNNGMKPHIHHKYNITSIIAISDRNNINENSNIANINKQSSIIHNYKIINSNLNLNNQEEVPAYMKINLVPAEDSDNNDKNKENNENSIKSHLNPKYLTNKHNRILYPSINGNNSDCVSIYHTQLLNTNINDSDTENTNTNQNTNRNNVVNIPYNPYPHIPIQLPRRISTNLNKYPRDKQIRLKITEERRFRYGCQHRGKVFGIGMFKTGTSSLTDALNILGYPCAFGSSTTSCKHSPLWNYYYDWSFPYFIGSDDISWMFQHPGVLKYILYVVYLVLFLFEFVVCLSLRETLLSLHESKKIKKQIKKLNKNIFCILLFLL